MTRKVINSFNEGYFMTFDLSLASSLVTLGYEITAIDKTNRTKAQFAFHRQQELDRDIKRYWDGNLHLSARHLFDNQKMIKNRLFSD